ncbi:MAG: sodium ion-translocating decarboxylase subunit beta, partial [Campylobacteraceae bacterium]|nr:sodium ion-translocating decarboxylase subunit beta [Campylobacteraceae bacterium]
MKSGILNLIAVLFFSLLPLNLNANAPAAPSFEQTKYEPKSMKELITSFYETTGIYSFLNPQEGLTDSSGEEITAFSQRWGRIIMIGVTFLLFYLAIAKGFEPLLLIPIGFGGLLANIPIADIAGPNGFLGIIYNAGIANGLFPLIIFLGVGAMTDFGPLIANPKTALLGGAAQLGIFG